MATYDSENTFVALVDRNGFIRDMSVSRRGEIIGIDYQKEEEYKQIISEMQETLDNYYGKLLELGAITIPKTPEQIAQENAAEQLRIVQEQGIQQAEINQALLSAIENLNAEIKELKSNGDGRNINEHGRSQGGNDSQSNGTVRKSSKIGAPSGEENVT